MKTQEQLIQKLKYCKTKLDSYEGHLTEDPDLNYLRGCEDTLKWILSDEDETRNQSRADDLGISAEESNRG